jgi:hypothetical protein
MRTARVWNRCIIWRSAKALNWCVATTYGNNAFFVRRDLYPLLGIVSNDPSVLFRPAMHKLRYVGHNTFLSGHPYRYAPAEQI